MYRRTDHVSQPDGGAQELTCDPRPSRLGQHRDDAARSVRSRALGGERGRRARPRATVRLQRAPADQLACGQPDLFVEGSVEDEEVARVLHRSGCPYHGRTPGLAPWAGAEILGGEAPQPIRGDGRSAGGFHFARVTEALGDAEHGGQRDLDILGSVVVFESEAERGAEILDVPDAAREGETEQLSQFGSDLSGLAVDGVETEQDEVEGSRHHQGRRQDAGGGQRVRAREGGVAAMEACVGTPSDALAQDVLGTGGTERHHGARPPGLPGQRDPFCHGPATIRIHLDRDTVADEAAILEAERFGERHLFEEGGDAQRIPGETGSWRSTPCGASAARLWPRGFRGWKGVPGQGGRSFDAGHDIGVGRGSGADAIQRATAPPSGLRGSEAPTRRTVPSPPRSAAMIWAQPTATGSKELMALTR